MTKISENQNHIVNVIRMICTAHPDTQTIYLYGTWGTEYQRRDSDIDIAVLLPYEQVKEVDSPGWRLLAIEVTLIAKVEYADLINLRCVNTTFQAEILRTGRLIQCADEKVRLRFEGQILSMYQKLNRERAEIRSEIIRSGRVYAQ